MRLLSAALLAFGGVALASAQTSAPLPALGARLDGLTVSGISSGGYMAIQFAVAHSQLVTGVGALAGGPYDCAEGSMWRAVNHCMSPTWGARPPDPARTRERIQHHARAGLIDPPEALRDDRVWLLSGDADRTVDRTVVDALAAFYRSALPADKLRVVALPDAGHAMISVADDAPNACPTSEPPFINRCGDFDAAGELLTHLLGPLAPRREAPEGTLLAFPQASFTALAPFELSLGDTGYAYVPRACGAGGCRVHVAFHGCRQSAQQIGVRFVQGAGYNEWAEDNRLIVLYPQTVPRNGFAWGSLRWVYNPKGCWDWWGYTDSRYATRDGAQIQAVRAMLEQLARPLPASPSQ